MINIILILFRLGILIGKYPWTTIIVTLIFFAVMSCGLVKFNASTDDEFLWTPYGSDVRFLLHYLIKVDLNQNYKF